MKNILFILLLISTLLYGCEGCSSSGSRRRERMRDQTPTSEPATGKHGKTVVKMEKEDGVFYIPTEVNGVKMRFIFDTGASMISLSQTEASFLARQGLLTEADVEGTGQFSDANGDISEGTLVRLRSVKIGDRELHDVQASVVGNMRAPLLLGQTALAKFGKISIDYKAGTITFE